MINKLQYRIPNTVFQNLKNEIPEFDQRIDINSPTGNFFYDPWTVSDEFKNTGWQTVLDCLPFPIGEARLMKLNPGTAYYSHADIDDRYHLNITGEKSFLVDLDKNELHSVNNDGYWYEMNAGIRHSAVNFGNETRIQLVVRKLLTQNKLNDPVRIKISVDKIMHDYRYIFDDIYSPCINRMIKQGSIDQFSVKDKEVFLNVEKTSLTELEKICPAGLRVTICQ